MRLERYFVCADRMGEGRTGCKGTGRTIYKAECQCIGSRSLEYDSENI